MSYRLVIPYLLLWEAIHVGNVGMSLYALFWSVVHPLLATWQVYGYKSQVKWRPLFIFVNFLPGAFLSPLFWLFFQTKASGEEGGGSILWIYIRNQFQKAMFNIIPAFGLGLRYLISQHQLLDRVGWETLLGSLLINGVMAGIWRLTMGRWFAWVGRLAFAVPLVLYHFLPMVFNLGPYVISVANPAFSQPFLWISIFHFVTLRHILSLFMGTSAANRWANRWASYPSDGDLLIKDAREWIKDWWERDGRREPTKAAASTGSSAKTVRSRLASLPPRILNQIEWERDLSIDASIRIGHVTAAYVAPKTLEDLQTILHFTYEHMIPRFVIGGATNVLIANRVDGLVISLKYFTKYSVDPKRRFVEAQAGVPLRQLVQATADAGLAVAGIWLWNSRNFGWGLVHRGHLSQNSFRANDARKWSFNGRDQ